MDYGDRHRGDCNCCGAADTGSGAMGRGHGRRDALLLISSQPESRARTSDNPPQAGPFCRAPSPHSACVHRSAHRECLATTVIQSSLTVPQRRFIGLQQTSLSSHSPTTPVLLPLQLPRANRDSPGSDVRQASSRIVPAPCRQLARSCPSHGCSVGFPRCGGESCRGQQRHGRLRLPADADPRSYPERRDTRPVLNSNAAGLNLVPSFCCIAILPMNAEGVRLFRRTLRKLVPQRPALQAAGSQRPEPFEPEACLPRRHRAAVRKNHPPPSAAQRTPAL